MVTKCNQKYLGSDEAYNCENPRISTDTIVPVTDVYTKVHYRNRFCAYCNGIDKDRQFVNWKLKVLNTEYVLFPKPDFFDYIRQTRGNVFFLPPRYVATETCEPVPEYKISTCNESGLWSKYDDIADDVWEFYAGEIESACASFIDPFNYTYKNYFCMLCNTEFVENIANSTNWICPHDTQRATIIKPEFSLVVELQIITGGQTAEELVCSDSQFLDDKLVRNDSLVDCPFFQIKRVFA